MSDSTSVVPDSEATSPAFETEAGGLGNSVDDASVNVAKSVADTLLTMRNAYDELARQTLLSFFLWGADA